MAITITSAPSTSEPIPVSDCLRWVMQADSGDVITTPGVQATLIINFPVSPSDPGNGTMFTMWGFVMTTNSGTDYTATSFKVEVGDRLQTMNNFSSMVLANFYFNRAVTVEVGATAVTLTWDECGEQVNFGATQMDFSNITGSAITSAVPTNGTTPVYVDAFRILHRLMRANINTGEVTAVTEFEGIEPNKTCTDVDAAEFDGMPTARELIKTPMPDLDNTHPTVEYDGIIQYFFMGYGWVYRDDNCQALSGDFGFTEKSFVWNAYFQPEDVYRVRKYWPGAAGGLPPGQSHVKFLTTQPESMRVFTKSRCWLWYMVNEAVQSFSQLKLRVVAQRKDGGTPSIDVNITNSGYGVNAVNVSPAYIISLGLTGVTEATLDNYTVAIYGDSTQFTEPLSYYMIDGCDNAKHTDLYFLNPIGGISTMPVEIIERNANQQGTEILLDVPCTATRADKARYGGRTLSNIRSYESLTFRAVGAGAAITDFFKDLKYSPQRWVRRLSEDGTWIARKLIIEPGGIRIYQDGPNVTVEASGYLGDIPIQSNTEPII